MDTGYQLTRIHGLGKEIVGAGLDPLDAIFHAVECGHDDDGDEPCLFVALEDAAGGEAVHHRHHHVQKNQIGGVARDLVDRLLAVAGTDRLVAEVLQLLLQVVDVEWLVIDDKDLGSHERCPAEPVVMSGRGTWPAWRRVGHRSTVC